MKSLFVSQSEKEHFVKIHTDPFKQECFENAHFWISKNIFDKGLLEYKAAVSFKNGATKGEQRFQEKTFSELVFKVDNFIKSL